MVPNLIDHIIEVEEKLLFAGDFSRGDQKSRQWFTRLYYLARSPFKITWYFDSHAVFAIDKVNQLLQQFDDLDIDVATANSSPHSFSCHNFSILFKWNDRVKLRFQDWILAQLRAGITFDDQGTLQTAMRNGQKYGLRPGELNPKFAAGFLSEVVRVGKSRVRDSKRRFTNVIWGRPYIGHSNEANQCGSLIEDDVSIPTVVTNGGNFHSQDEVESEYKNAVDVQWGKYQDLKVAYKIDPFLNPNAPRPKPVTIP